MQTSPSLQVARARFDVQNRRMTETRTSTCGSRATGAARTDTAASPRCSRAGWRSAAEEIEAADARSASNNVFRYYGVGDGPHEVPTSSASSPSTWARARALRQRRLVGAHLRADRRGVGPGDEVIVPGYTWNATPNAVIAAGRDPVLAEVDESLTLDPDDVARKIGPRTKAILPVHMRGAPADMEALTALAREHGLVARSRTSARRPAPRSAAGGSAPSATPARSACSSTRSSPPAKAA